MARTRFVKTRGQRLYEEVVLLIPANTRTTRSYDDQRIPANQTDNEIPGTSNDGTRSSATNMSVKLPYPRFRKQARKRSGDTARASNKTGSDANESTNTVISIIGRLFPESATNRKYTAMARTKSAKGNNRKQKVRKPWKHTAAGKSKDPTSTYQYSYEEIKAIRAKDVEECNFCMMQFGAGNGEKLKTHVAYFCPKLPLSYHQRSLVMTDIKNHVTHMNTDGSALFSVVKKKPSHPLLLCEINGKGINPSIAADALSWIPNRPGVIVGDPCILDFWHCRGNYDICGKKYSTSPVSMNVGKELLLKLHGIIWKVEDHKDVFQWNTNHSNRIDDRTDVNALARLLIRQHAKRVAFKEFIKAGMETKSLNRVILFMLHWHRWESSALWRKCNEKSANEGSKGKRNAGNHAGLLVVDIRYSADDTIISPVYYESFVEKDTYYKHVLWRSGHRHFCNFMKNLFGKSMCVKSENIRFYKNIIPNGCVPTAFFHAAQAKMFPVINGPSSSRTIAGLQIWLREFKRFHKQSDDNKAMKIPINKAKALFDRINHSMESLAFEFEV